MTQAELDALMADGVDNMDEELVESEKEQKQTPPKESHDAPISNQHLDEYRVSSDISWPPPTKDHKMVHQLEDSKRVSSAVHNEGDETTQDVVTNEGIEALINSLGKK